MWRTMNAQARIAIERALLSDEEWEKIAEIAMPMALKNPTLDLGTYTSGDGYNARQTPFARRERFRCSRSDKTCRQMWRCAA
jgi:hypothetical protein